MRFAALALLALTVAACSADEEVSAAPTIETSLVGEVLSVSVGQMVDGVMITAIARDGHNGSHSPTLLPAGQRGDTLIYDFTVERRGEPLGNRGPINITGVTIVDPQTILGMSSVLVRGANGQSGATLPGAN
ncbi:hypothetical protein FHS89_002649 [Rubricella aquisinus]|uniref:Lipoprotein n=1 Tax=Rubricella aquisinus TaxID=2028108 RepID=A0A840WNH4_9RHOB|nr:hypothetical protein [Rubricella aquisinus]MBB5516618.1 hypothetical protein [Rubricella aquisinus]